MINLAETLNQNIKIEDFLKILGIFIGGAWVLYLFLLKRERYPKVEFDLDINIIERNEKRLIIEFIAILENKGIARHKINLKEFNLDIRYLRYEDLNELTNKIETKDSEFFALNFPNSITNKKEEKPIWMPLKDEYIFIDGGTKQKLSLPLSIDVKAKILLIKSKYKYKEKASDFHSAQRVFNLDKM